MFKPVYEYIVALLLIIIQIAILNNIHIFGWAPPFIMIYPIIFAPILKGHNESLISSFILGLIADLFSNTLGINCFAFLSIAFLRTFILSPYKAHEVSSTTRPTLKLLGVTRYLSFVTILTFVFCSLIYLLELSSFSNIGITLVKVAISTVSSLTLFTALQLMNAKP